MPHTNVAVTTGTSDLECQYQGHSDLPPRDPGKNTTYQQGLFCLETRDDCAPSRVLKTDDGTVSEPWPPVDLGYSKYFPLA